MRAVFSMAFLVFGVDIKSSCLEMKNGDACFPLRSDDMQQLNEKKWPMVLWPALRSSCLCFVAFV